MVSNIAPVTSLPWLELSKVKVRTSAVRIDHDSVAALGLEATPGFLLVMAGTVYKECRPVKWRGDCLYDISRTTFFEFTESEKELWRFAR